MDILFPLVLSDDNYLPHYTVPFNNGTTSYVPLGKMAGIIPSSPIEVNDSDSQDSFLPPFLHLNSKITTANIIKVFLKNMMESTPLYSCHMSTCKKKTGAFHLLTFLSLGLICVLKVSSFLVISHIHSFSLPCPWYGASQCGAKNNTINLILRLCCHTFFYIQRP
jgi:hypothetical protein